MAAFGFVHDGSNAREFVVEVFRPSKVTRLEELLVEWEVHGFLQLKRAG